MKSTTFIVLLLTLIAKSTYGTPPDKDDSNLTGQAIRRATEQNVLLIQLAQLYALQLIDQPNTKSYKNKITVYRKQFEENYTFIKSLKLKKYPYSQIEEVNKQWQKFKLFFDSPSEANNIPPLLFGIDSLSAACNLVSDVLISSSLFTTLHASPFLKYHQLGHTIRQTVHQKVYCERITLYYLIARVQSDISPYASIIQQNAEDYQHQIKLLKQSTLNTPIVDYKIYQLEYEWDRFQVLCDNVNQLPQIKLSEVITIRDYLSDRTNQIAAIYVQLMDEKVAAAMFLEMLPVASRQRILTQTITRAYLGITAEVEVDNHKNLLTTNKKQFDRNLEKLKNYAPNTKIQKAIDQVAFLWKSYTLELSKRENTTSNASKLLQYNTELLRVCNNLVILLKLHAQSIPRSGNFNRFNINLFDKNTKQAMLSERLLLYYMANEWDSKNKLFPKLLNKTVGQYNRGLQEIKRNISAATPSMKKIFVTVLGNWKVGQKVFQRNHAISEAFVVSKLLSTDLLLLAKKTNQLIISPTKNQAINMATRQSMLTQKITSHILLYSIDKQNQLQLEKDLMLFDEQLIELKKYITTPKAAAALHKLKSAWDVYQKSIEDKTIFEKDAKELLNNSTKLLSYSDLLSTRIFADNRKVDLKTTTAMSIAGHQRTILQKLILYTILDTKNTSPKVKKQLQSSWNTYRFTHRNLNKLSLKSPNIEKHLDQIMLTSENLESRWLQDEKLTLKQIIWYQQLFLIETESLVLAYQNIRVKD